MLFVGMTFVGWDRQTYGSGVIPTALPFVARFRKNPARQPSAAITGGECVSPFTATVE
jgi:hypothetical protein